MLEKVQETTDKEAQEVQESFCLTELQAKLQRMGTNVGYSSCS